MTHDEIVAWLESEAGYWNQIRQDRNPDADMARAIADELERLAAENARLRRDLGHQATHTQRWIDYGSDRDVELKEVRAENEQLKRRLGVIDLPGGDPGEGGWSSRSETRQRIGAVLEAADAGSLDDDQLDAVAQMIDAVERERIRAEETCQSAIKRAADNARALDAAHKAWGELRHRTEKDFEAGMTASLEWIDLLDPRRQIRPDPDAEAQ